MGQRRTEAVPDNRHQAGRASQCDDRRTEDAEVRSAWVEKPQTRVNSPETLLDRYRGSSLRQRSRWPVRDSDKFRVLDPFDESIRAADNDSQLTGGIPRRKSITGRRPAICIGPATPLRSTVSVPVT